MDFPLKCFLAICNYPGMQIIMADLTAVLFSQIKINNYVLSYQILSVFSHIFNLFAKGLNRIKARIQFGLSPISMADLIIFFKLKSFCHKIPRFYFNTLRFCTSDNGMV